MAGMMWGRFPAVTKARALIALGAIALAGAGMLIGSQPAVLAEDLPDQAEMLRLDMALTADPSDIHTRLRLASLEYLDASNLAKAKNYGTAAEEFGKGLALLQDSGGAVPEGYSLMQAMRYGLGYSDLVLQQYRDAVTALQPLVASAPDYTQARILYGVALMGTGTPANLKSGMDELAQAAARTQGTEHGFVVRAATRWSYNEAVTLAVQGRNADALAVLTDLRARFGTSSGTDAAENDALQYTFAYLTAKTGNGAAAAPEFETLYKRNAAFAPANGTSLKTVVSNLYYNAGLAQLVLKTKEGSAQAITLFNKADEYGSGRDLDVMTGLALAYSMLDQQDQVQAELARMQGVVEAAQTTTLEQHPNDADALLLRANARARQDNLVGAVGDYTRLLQIKPGDPDALYNRGMALLLLARYADAQKDFDAVLAIDPKDGPSLVARGFALRMQGQDAAGRAAEGKALTAAPGDATTLALAATFGVLVEPSPVALQKLATAVAADPKEPTLRFNRGLVLLNQGQDKAALAEFDRARQLGMRNADLEYLRAVSALSIHENSVALSALDNAIAQRPAYVPALTLRARMSFAAQAYRKAEVDLDALIRIDPLDAVAYRLRGACQLNLGENKSAVDTYTTALKLDPKNTEALFNRGNAEMALRDHAAAQTDFAKAVQIEPNYPLAQRQLGNALFHLKQYAPAAEAYQAALGLDPNDAVSTLRRAEALEADNKYEQAVDAYTRALALQPKDASIYRRRGNTEYGLNRFTEAAADYTEAAKLAPNDALTQYRLGNTYVRLDMSAKARASYDKALQLDPNIAGAYTNRGLLSDREGKREQACVDWRLACSLKDETACSNVSERCK